MKKYNLVVYDEKKKYAAIALFRELGIIYEVSGYGSGYYIGIETDLAPEWVELELISKGVI